MIARRLRDLAADLFPWRHRSLLTQMAARDIAMRYRQSWLGWAWLVLTPIAMLAVYTLVFKHVFQVRWGGADEGGLAFALRIYAGFAVFSFFAEYMNRAPMLIAEQPHLVKKVVFPLQIIPWVALLSALVGLLVASGLLLALSLISFGRLPLTAIALWLVWLPLVPLCLGLGWATSALGTYIRDIGQVVSVVMSALVFVSPVFFPVQVLPAVAQRWMWLNPLADPMTQTRRVLLEGQWPDWTAWGLSMMIGVVIACLGALLFRKLRPGFSDVL
jgi:lipopolysaccharide transport system permease protein